MSQNLGLRIVGRTHDDANELLQKNKSGACEDSNVEERGGKGEGLDEFQTGKKGGGRVEKT